MKKSLFCSLGLVAMIAMSVSSVWAVPVPVLTLPTGNQIEIKFRNFETVVTLPFPPGVGQATGTEDNWGIFRVTTITDLTTQSVLFAETPGLTLGQISGTFWGLDIDDVTGGPGNFNFNLNSGVGAIDGKAAGLNMWFDDPANGGTAFDNDGPAVGPGTRAGDDKYDTATDGTKLFETVFASGIAGGTGDCTTVIQGSVNNLALPANGSAAGFMNVVSGSGAWANQLDSNAIATGCGARDMQLFNRFDTANEFGGTGGPGNGFPLLSQDPVIASTVPEPGTVFLLGSGLLSIVALTARRRRQS